MRPPLDVGFKGLLESKHGCVLLVRQHRAHTHTPAPFRSPGRAFSTSELLVFWVSEFFILGLACVSWHVWRHPWPHQKPVPFLLSPNLHPQLPMTAPNVSKCCQMCPGGQNLPWLKSTASDWDGKLQRGGKEDREWGTWDFSLGCRDVFSRLFLFMEISQRCLQVFLGSWFHSKQAKYYKYHFKL